MTYKPPKCMIENCQNFADNLGIKNPDGSTKYRSKIGIGWICGTHHKNFIHRAIKHRKDYCENIDGRLGPPCTTTIVWSGMLDVDHKNGNPADNRLENLQTLCKCCHAYKTHLFKDYNSPGRKSLGLSAILKPNQDFNYPDDVVFPMAHDDAQNLFEFEKSEEQMIVENLFIIEDIKKEN